MISPGMFASHSRCNRFVGAGNHPFLFRKRNKRNYEQNRQGPCKPKIEMNLKPGDIVKVKAAFEVRLVCC